MSALRRFVSLTRQIMRDLRVLLRFGMISLVVILSSLAMRLGGVIVVFGGVVMCVLGHYFSLLAAISAATIMSKHVSDPKSAGMYASRQTKRARILSIRARCRTNLRLESTAIP
jgi:hypothetical protein